MTKVLKKQIIKEASEIKDFIEKNGKIPNTNTINNTKYTIYATSYLMSKLILTNFKQDIQNINVIKYDVATHKDTIHEDVYKNDYLDMVKRFCSYCEAHHHVPSTIHTKKSNVKVSFELYVYCISKIINFYHKNKYLPNYCLFNKADLQNTKSNTKNTQKTPSKSTSTNKKTVKKDNCTNPYTSTPHPTKTGCNQMGQNTNYFCGVSALHKVLHKFGITKYSQNQLAKYAGTTTAGTDHKGLETAIAKVSKETGIKLTAKWYNFSELGFEKLGKLICKPNVDAIIHLYYRNKYGHYEVINEINIKSGTVKVLNSLGNKCGTNCFCGYVESRSFALEKQYINGISQKSVLIITKG